MLQRRERFDEMKQELKARLGDQMAALYVLFPEFEDGDRAMEQSSPAPELSAGGGRRKSAKRKKDPAESASTPKVSGRHGRTPGTKQCKGCKKMFLKKEMMETVHPDTEDTEYFCTPCHEAA